jgi:hypothetical protein
MSRAGGFDKRRTWALKSAVAGRLWRPGARNSSPGSRPRAAARCGGSCCGRCRPRPDASQGPTTQGRHVRPPNLSRCCHARATPQPVTGSQHCHTADRLAPQSSAMRRHQSSRCAACRRRNITGPLTYLSVPGFPFANGSSNPARLPILRGAQEGWPRREWLACLPRGDPLHPPRPVRH